MSCQISTEAADFFTATLIAWQRQHGRHHLPWQCAAASRPYLTWVSEIMLQQTQVTTVIPYFTRFIARFPHPHELAQASLDEVLRLWAGLGYYARARNLHRSAQLIVTLHGGQIPQDFDQLVGLPGIGASTAGAILALGFNQPYPILDAHARRILMRYFALGENRKTLWSCAYQLVSRQQPAIYVQGLMDLGAQICTARSPACKRCPLQQQCCFAREPIRAALTVARSPKPVRIVWMLLLHDGEQRWLLEKRPPTGIWGGLWSLPEALNLKALCERFHLLPEDCMPLPSRRHSFTHYHLDFTPVYSCKIGNLVEESCTDWFTLAVAEQQLALPAPILRLLRSVSRTMPMNSCLQNQ